MTDIGFSVQAGDEVRAGLRNAKLHGHEIISDQFAQAVDEFWHALPGFHGNKVGLRKPDSQEVQRGMVGESVDFIKD